MRWLTSIRSISPAPRSQSRSGCLTTCVGVSSLAGTGAGDGGTGVLGDDAGRPHGVMAPLFSQQTAAERVQDGGISVNGVQFITRRRVPKCRGALIRKVHEHPTVVLNPPAPSLGSFLQPASQPVIHGDP
ncbi:hypothetical protein EX30DRAFT_244930 [Ascodesmis nigricans]|uniref:Uncharacterized protein n=1 Tax=Ascodesmis nigricans TaxID=341454 RepID=A0A4V3SHK6_9PEZI|nr:hypothetical protein EX30DRAFT_244930 [Ascodesmis nigricans]